MKASEQHCSMGKWVECGSVPQCLHIGYIVASFLPYMALMYIVITVYNHWGTAPHSTYSNRVHALPSVCQKGSMLDQ